LHLQVSLVYLSSQSSLESLSLQNVGCSIHACRAVEELFQASQNLRQLHLFNNMSDNEVRGSIDTS
jgi:large subunit ribosomal protein L31/Ran GTPase-activating protein 1